MSNEQNKLQDNAEYQRRRMMTKDEKAIDARDRVAKNLYEERQKQNSRETYEDCQRHVTKKLRERGTIKDGG